MNYSSNLALYQPLKKYFSITRQSLGIAYKRLSIGHKVYDILHDEQFERNIFGGAMSWKYRELLPQFLESTGADVKRPHTQTWSKLLNEYEKLRDKGVIFNFESETGIEANKALTIIAKRLIDKFGRKEVVVLNGLKFNNLMTDFEQKGNDLNKYLEGKFLIFYANNAIMAKDYWKEMFSQLLLGASMNNITILTSSNTKWNFKGYQAIDVAFKDEEANVNQVLNNLFGD
jgi:hypothetical protein